MGLSCPLGRKQLKGFLFSRRFDTLQPSPRRILVLEQTSAKNPSGPGNDFINQHHLFQMREFRIFIFIFIIFLST